MARNISFALTTPQFIALGFAGVCRLMEWSPVNVTVNITNPPGYASTFDPKGPGS